ncbi:MAG TPA: hypothetical protein VFM88_03420 [Vicinamibacteria bacterium]|nr:hypothetical protein [Vicinamibacteria bacterium]
MPFLVGLAATALLLAVALSLGSWGYKYRRSLFHRGRLERLLELRPADEQVRAGLEGEGGRILARATTAAELAAAAARFTPELQGEVVSAGARASETTFFSVGEMVYVVFFDGEGKMSGFRLVEARP